MAVVIILRRVQDLSPLLRYALAVVSVTFATALRLAAEPTLGDHSPFMLVFLSVLMTAWYAGRRPALVAVVLGSIATYWMLHQPPAPPDVDIAYWAGLIGFLMAAIATIELTMGMRRAQARARAADERLDLALAAGNMGVWEWDLSNNEVWWSDSVEPVHGLPRGAFGRTFEAFRQLDPFR